MLLDQLERIGGGEPCVVVGHSIGGTIATVAAEREPALFHHLVFVTSVVPGSAGLSMAEWWCAPALQRRIVRELDEVSAAPTTVVELPSTHSPFLSHPAELADVIATVR